MWPFGRKVETATPVEPSPVVPQMHFDWKSLPPMQRTLADHPLTIPTEAFATELATHDDARVVAHRLGHNVSLEAPAGIVLGIARPQVRSGGPDLVPPSRPRHHPVAQRAADVSEVDTPDMESVAVESPAPAAEPMRRLAVSEARLPSVQLTRVTPENEPQPLPLPSDTVIGAAEAPAATTETAESAASGGPAQELPTYPRLTLGQARRLGLGAPIGRVPDSAATTPIQRSTEPAPPTEPPAPTSEPAEAAPQFQPFLLDFLINKRPEVTAPAPISRPQRVPLRVSRSVSSEPTADSTASVEPAAGLPVTPDESHAPVESSPAGPLAGSPDLFTATHSTQSVLAETAGGPTDEGSPAPPPALPLALGEVSGGVIAAPVPAGMPSDAAAMAPLISERPKLATAVQRAAASQPSPSTAGGAEGVRIHRDTDAAARTAAMDARAFTERGEVFLPASHGPLDHLPGRAILAHELVHADQQRRQDGPRPDENGEDGRRMDAEAVTVQRSVATNAPLPLARTSWPSAQTTSWAQPAPSVQTSSAVEAWSAPRTASAVLERAIDDGEPATIQRAPVHGWQGSAAADLSSPAMAVRPSATGDAAPHGGDEEAQMEELAGKLYDRLRIRLRNELLVDRERAGFLTDVR